jgi:hypothetical protein
MRGSKKVSNNFWNVSTKLAKLQNANRHENIFLSLLHADRLTAI